MISSNKIQNLINELEAVQGLPNMLELFTTIYEDALTEVKKTQDKAALKRMAAILGRQLAFVFRLLLTETEQEEDEHEINETVQ